MTSIRNYIKEPPLGVIRENGPLNPREQGALPKIRKGAGSKENVIWEQGAQKLGKGNREQEEKLKRSREQREIKRSSGNC